MNNDPAKTPFAVTLDVGSSLLNKTGSWRSERPVGFTLPKRAITAVPGNP
jgi:hypothetical protein